MSNTSFSLPIKQFPDDFSIDNFVEFKHFILDNQLILGYKQVEHTPSFVTLERDGLFVIFASSKAIGSAQKLAEFIKLKHSENNAIFCVGNREEILDFYNHSPETNLLALPTSTLNIKTLLDNFHRFQLATRKIRNEKEQATTTSEEVKYVLSVSRELNGERDIIKLLNLILKKAREVTGADAGSIYTIDQPDPKNISNSVLRFRYTQNDSINQNLSEFELPINDKSIVGNAIIHRKTINIPDLYTLDAENNPFNLKHDRSWDLKTGYESHSMLTVPMFDISHSPIGVIQLINSKTIQKKLSSKEDFKNYVRPFDVKATEYAEIVAKQAGIALENANMQRNIQDLFDGFVDASVKAIELRDPTTCGHSHRVAQMTLGLAQAVHREGSGIYKNIYFNEDQMLEIRYASLLHDIGKLGVREHVLVKAKKLYPFQFSMIKERFLLIRSQIEIRYLEELLRLERNPKDFPPGTTAEAFVAEKMKKFTELDKYFDFICKANEPTILEQGGFELLKDISGLSFNDPLGNRRPYLFPDELKALSVARGSLTAEEFTEIQNHVVHTYEFLRKIPWGVKLANVPQIAAKHHEKLDGSGYPNGAEDEAIPLQSRMMTIADIYDALTAADRPYKKAMPYKDALNVLEHEVKSQRIDKDLFKLFVDAKVYELVLPEKTSA